MLPKVSKRLRELVEKITYRHWVMLAGAASILLGVLVFVSLNSNKPEQERVVPVNNVHVVVAKQDIAPKTIIREGMLELREMPAHLVSGDAFSDISEVVNKPAGVQIMKDDVLSRRKVLMDIRMAGFTGDIPPNCRAVSIGISDETGVAGFAQPGDFVDVMLIARDGAKMSGRIVLQDVLLLAINKAAEVQNGAAGGQSSQKNEGQSDSQGTVNSSDKNNDKGNKAGTRATDNPVTATLALRPEEALRLVTEAQEGTLYLTLRPYQPRDRIVADTKYVHYSSVQAQKKEAPDTAGRAANGFAAAARPVPAQAPAAAPAYAAPSAGGVEVIRGTTVSREGY